MTDFRVDFQRYLDDLEHSPIKDLQALIDFNMEHSDKELPPGMSKYCTYRSFWLIYERLGHANQQILVDAVDLKLSPTEYDHHLQHLRHVARTQGVDCILTEYGVDVIIGPADSFLSSLASGAGRRLAHKNTMPKADICQAIRLLRCL